MTSNVESHSGKLFTRLSALLGYAGSFTWLAVFEDRLLSLDHLLSYSLSLDDILLKIGESMPKMMSRLICAYCYQHFSRIQLFEYPVH